MVDDLQPIMVTDSGVSSHPIVVDVKNPDQINEVFDGISYSKVGGSCLLFQTHPFSHITSNGFTFIAEVTFAIADVQGNMVTIHRFSVVYTF